MIYSRNTAKNLSDCTNLPANMFLCGVRKNICTTPFRDSQELHSWSTLKANVFIFLYISLKKLFPRRSKVISGVCVCVWGGGMGGDWINFLRQFAVWALENVLHFFVLIEIFENSTIFSISVLLFIAIKRLNFPDNLYFKGKIAATFPIRSRRVRGGEGGGLPCPDFGKKMP